MTEPERTGAAGADHAGVRIAPPKLFLFSLVLGFVLDWLWPLGWLDAQPGWLRFGLGGLFVLAGIGIMAWALGLFREAGTAVPPWEPTTALVTAGAYRYSRNPMYLAVVLLYFGLSLLFAAAWPLMVLVPALIVLHVAVIFREEAYLERRFGDAYRQYRARVRRWF